MDTTYTETPDNFCEIAASVITDIDTIKRAFYKSDKVLFYDTCSLQRHSNLKDAERAVIFQYYKKQGISIFIARCVLMELSGDKNMLLRQYVDFINSLNDAGIKVVLLNEEYVYCILSDCFASNEIINEYLMWAVRMVKTPISTITDTLKADLELNSELVGGKKLNSSGLYQRFFTAVRSNKEHEDNLGEELLSICVNILSHLPGIKDGKLCVLTDDKGAAAKIDSVMRRTPPQNRGSKILLFSTPKLVQHMFLGNMEITEDEIINILSQGVSGNIVVMGISEYDLVVDSNISLSVKELAQTIMKPNGIRIVF